MKKQLTLIGLTIILLSATSNAQNIKKLNDHILLASKVNKSNTDSDTSIFLLKPIGGNLVYFSKTARGYYTRVGIYDSAGQEAELDTNNIWHIQNAKASVTEMYKIIKNDQQQLDSINTILYYFRREYGNIGQDSVKSIGFMFADKWYKVDKYRKQIEIEIGLNKK